MDTFALGQLINAGLQLGPVGLVCVIWYFDRKDQARLIEDHRKETAAILAKYESDAAAAREMYSFNPRPCARGDCFCVLFCFHCIY